MSQLRLVDSLIISPLLKQTSIIGLIKWTYDLIVLSIEWIIWSMTSPLCSSQCPMDLEPSSSSIPRSSRPLVISLVLFPLSFFLVYFSFISFFSFCFSYDFISLFLILPKGEKIFELVVCLIIY